VFAGCASAGCASAAVAVSELLSLMLVALTAVAEGSPLLPTSVAPSQATFLTLPQCDPFFFREGGGVTFQARFRTCLIR
jgi:hypothetical protein